MSDRAGLPVEAADRPSGRYWTVLQLSRRWADQDGPMPITTIYDMVKRGDLKAKRHGTRIKISHAEVLRYEAADLEPATVPMTRAVSTPTLDALAAKWGL